MTSTVFFTEGFLPLVLKRKHERLDLRILLGGHFQHRLKFHNGGILLPE